MLGILLLGDSLVRCGNKEPHNWERLLGCRPVFCEGVTSDTTARMLDRLPVALDHLRPMAVFLLASSNDHREGMTIEDTGRAVSGIARTCWRRSVTLVVQAILPVNRDFPAVYCGEPAKFNAEIAKRNAAIRASVLTLHGVHWIDWGRDLTNVDYDKDGLHLSASGFTKWGLALAPYINLYR